MDRATLEHIKECLEWGKGNLESPLDNLDVEQVEALIAAVEKGVPLT